MQHASGHDDLDLRAHRQLHGDVDGVGDHGEARMRAGFGQVGAGAEGVGDGRGRGAAAEPDHGPLRHDGARRGSDALLLLCALLVLVAQRQVVGDGVADGPSAGAGEQLVLGQRVEITPGRRWRDAQGRHDVVDVDVTALRQQVEHGGQAFGAVHDCPRPDPDADARMLQRCGCRRCLSGGSGERMRARGSTRSRARSAAPSSPASSPIWAGSSRGRRWKVSRASRRFVQRGEEGVPRLCEPAADHDGLRCQQGDHLGQSEGETVDGLVPDGGGVRRHRRRRARALRARRRPDSPLRSRVATHDRAGRCDGLEVPATSAGARRTAGDDDRVADLAGVATGDLHLCRRRRRRRLCRSRRRARRRHGGRARLRA